MFIALAKKSDLTQNTHQHVRRSVFETNSSSSHSLTLGSTNESDLCQTFDIGVLRKGSIQITPPVDHFGWNFFRFYKLENKITYLLAQVAMPDQIDELFKNSGKVAPGSKEHTSELCKSNSKIQMIVNAVKKKTGVDMLFTRASFVDVDHQSDSMEADVAKPFFQDKDKLNQFLFNPASYVQTGNDNSSISVRISTDTGETVDVYAHIHGKPKASDLKVQFLFDSYYDFHNKDPLVLPKELLTELTENSSTVVTSVCIKGNADSSLGLGNRAYELMESIDLKVVANAPTTVELSKKENYTEKTVGHTFLTVSTSPELVKKISEFNQIHLKTELKKKKLIKKEAAGLSS